MTALTEGRAGLRAALFAHYDRVYQTCPRVGVKIDTSKNLVAVSSVLVAVRRGDGRIPSEWVLQERVAQARNLLEASRMSIEQVATATGFCSADTLRHHFRTRLDTSPARYRSSFRA